MEFRAILPRRLYQEIALQIRAHIESGEFSAGARLPAERELAKLLRVSRPSIREALIALEVEGLVEVRTGAGVFVCERQKHLPSSASYEGPLEIMLARALIEGDIAARATAKMRRGDLNQLEQIVAAMIQSSTDQAACLLSDRAFHLYIAEKAGNSVLVRFVAELFDARHTPLSLQFGKHFENTRTWMLAATEHKQIIKAFAAHDPVAAKRAMERHLRKSCSRWTRQLAVNGVIDDR
ncbi:MAG: FadR family transcriptional regulator [Verrucomicrobia bacterium]|nr:FadR family transcriptional regulator [Verrucomicrobiota bacterium]